jgi:hypothetical protein
MEIPASGMKFVASFSAENRLSEHEHHPTNLYGVIAADSTPHKHSLSRNVNMDVYTQHRALVFNLRATLPGTAAT